MPSTRTNIEHLLATKRLVLVSPFTHLAGHYWPYTTDFLSAFAKRYQNTSVFAAHPQRPSSPLPIDEIQWNACCPWIRFILSDAYRNKNWGNKADTVARVAEFYFCLKAALKLADAETDERVHIHCIESRHGLLLNAVLKSKHSFSSLCVGGPPRGLTAEREDNYRKAFVTGRLKFIVETEAVRKAWEYLAADHVIHIPAALPWRTHEPRPQKLARRDLGLPEDRLVCLFFGTHREGKDYDLCIRAAVESGVEPYLLFAGPLISGNDPDTLLDKYGYTHSLSLKNFVPDDEVVGLFDACDTVMLPYSDGYSKGSAVLLQASHFEKPVIAPLTGHLGDFVTNNRTGVLYQPGNLNSLAEIYREMSAAKARGSLPSDFSFEKTKAIYSWDSLLHQYLRVFES